MSKMKGKKQTLSQEEQKCLVGELRVRGKLPPDWERLLCRLVRDGQIEKLRKDEVDGHEDAWESFLEIVEEEAEYQREIAKSVTGSARTPRRQEQDAPVAVGEKDERAAAICAEFLAHEAADDAVVKQFRERELGSPWGTLTHDAAIAYVWEEYRHALMAEMSAEMASRHLERRRARLNNHEVLFFLLDDLPRSVAHVFLLDATEQEATLGDVTAYLHWRYPWSEEQAAWFVLTGNTPAVRPVALKIEADHTFIIRVQPWTSRESVNAAYDAIFTPWVGNCHPPKGEALDLLEFVIEHTDEAGNLLKTWLELKELWNIQYPARRYDTYSGIRRAYKNNRKKLAPRRV